MHLLTQLLKMKEQEENVEKFPGPEISQKRKVMNSKDFPKNREKGILLYWIVELL